MEIPILYAVYCKRDIQAVTVGFEDGNAVVDSDTILLSSVTGLKSEEREPVLVYDVGSFKRRNLDDRVLKNVKVPGRDVWYLTYVESIEDVLDSFMGNIVKLVIPYHTTESSALLKEANVLSEDCIPAIFVKNGTAMIRNNETREILEVLEEIESMGYREIIMFDTDASIDENTMNRIISDNPFVIPYVHGSERPLGSDKSIVDQLTL